MFSKRFQCGQVFSFWSTAKLAITLSCRVFCVCVLLLVFAPVTQYFQDISTFLNRLSIMNKVTRRDFVPSDPFLVPSIERKTTSHMLYASNHQFVINEINSLSKLWIGAFFFFRYTLVHLRNNRPQLLYTQTQQIHFPFLSLESFRLRQRRGILIILLSSSVPYFSRTFMISDQIDSSYLPLVKLTSDTKLNARSPTYGRSPGDVLTKLIIPGILESLKRIRNMAGSCH